MERQDSYSPIHSKVIFRTKSRSIQHKDKYAPYRNYIKKKYGPNDPKYLQLANKGSSSKYCAFNNRKLKIDLRQDDAQTVLKQSKYRDVSFDKKSNVSSSKRKRQKSQENHIQGSFINLKTADTFLRRHSVGVGNNQCHIATSNNFLHGIYVQNEKLRKQLQQLKIRQGSQEIRQLRSINEFLLKENYKLKNTIERMQKESERLAKQLKDLEQEKNKIQSQKSIHEEDVKSLKQILQKKKVTFKVQEEEAREHSFEKKLQIIQLKEQLEFLNMKIKDLVKNSTIRNHKRLYFSIIPQTVQYQFKPMAEQHHSDAAISQFKVSISLINNRNNQKAVRFIRRANNHRRTSYDFRFQNTDPNCFGGMPRDRDKGNRRNSKKLLNNVQLKTILSSRQKDVKVKIKEQFHSYRKFYFSHESLAYEKRKLLTLQMIQRTITHKFKALNLTFQEWQDNACSLQKKVITVQQLFDILQSSPFSLPDNLTLLVIQYCFQSYVSEQDVCEVSHFVLKIRQFVKDYVPLTQSEKLMIEQKIVNFIVCNQIQLKESLVQREDHEGQVSQKIYEGVLKNFRISQKEISYIISKSIIISRDSNHINYRRFFDSFSSNAIEK